MSGKANSNGSKDKPPEYKTPWFGDTQTIYVMKG